MGEMASYVVAHQTVVLQSPLLIWHLPSHVNWVNAEWWNLRECWAFCVDSVDVESHSAGTQLTWSLTPRQLSQRQVRLHVNWVNAEWDSTSTESTRNDGIFVNVGPSALTQLMWSLIPLGLSWRGVSLRVDSVDGESHSGLTQCAEEKLYQNRHTYPALVPLKG
jgi:hypothetical protein